VASPAADDYLKTVYAHTEWQDAPITPSVLAAKLGIAPSSVTEMVKKLAAAGLVSHVPYGAVRLTDAGTQRALAMVRRHRLIETWLVQEFGYAWDEVHDEAEVLEHTISDRLLEGIDERLGRPRFDPHGDAIPDADGHVEREPFVLLADAPTRRRSRPGAAACARRGRPHRRVDAAAHPCRGRARRDRDRASRRCDRRRLAERVEGQTPATPSP
jgi:DtxR family Mn-dependent transcriptional regulator